MISTWQLPTGLAADKDALKVERMKYYRFNLIHCLRNGKRVIPTLETIQHILQAYDEFNLEVAISDGSFTYYVED
tara:strand:+ start:78 stop:302 length:225 start_codon:yes stop_codon:yes gene_type:complete